jgi:hypothetical protein
MIMGLLHNLDLIFSNLSILYVFSKNETLN